MNEKVCSRCKETKPVAEFGVDKRRGNPKAVCRPCDSAIHAELLRKNPPTEEQKRKRAEVAAVRYLRAKSKGRCLICGVKCYGRIYCDEHRAEKALKGRVSRIGKVRTCPGCNTSTLDYRRKLCSACADTTGTRWRTYQKAWRDSKKLEAFEKYGGAFCACCGESMLGFLTIDHINSDGADHRREIFSTYGRGRIYGWLRSHGYPSGFQVLCYNCNCGRQYSGTGICPHKTAAQ